MSSNPGSPGAPDPQSDAENDPPDADDEESSEPEHSGKFLVFYQKKYYEVPEPCVLLDGGKALPVENGQAMGVLHECKSFPFWVKAGAEVSHMVLLKADVGGGTTQRGVYVTFKSRGYGRSPDMHILRALHKSISKKYYAHFQAEFTDEEREKYAELIAHEPPEVKQISPVSCHWRELPKEEEPQNVLYRRKPGKKKEDEEDDDDAPVKGPAKKKAKVSPSVDPTDAHADDDQSSEPASTAIVPRFQGQVGAPAPSSGGFNFFAQTPGMITVDLEEWRKLNAFYYSNGGR